MDHARQWMCVPPAAQSTMRPRSLQEFKVLLETKRGRIVWFSVKQRAAPDLALIDEVAQCADDFTEPPDQAALAYDVSCPNDLYLDVLDGEITHEPCWGLEDWARLALLDAVLEGRISAGSGAETRDAIAQEQTLWFGEQMARFLAGLDCDVVEVLQSVGTLRPSHYNYLVSDNPVHRRNRLQAIRSYPILYRFLLGEKFAGIRSAIDEGQPLVDLLAKRYSVPRSVIRAVRGAAPLAASAPVDRFSVLLPLLRDIPPPWWPRTAADWKRFAEAARRVEAVSGHPIWTIHSRLALRKCAQRGYRLPDIDAAQWLRLGRRINDFLGGMRDALRFRMRGILPAHEAELFANRTTTRMLSSMGIERVDQLARRWGIAYRRAQAAFSAESELWRGARWPSLADAPVAAGGLVAHPMLTARALTYEGIAMKNCIATYAAACMDGTCQIWSMRTLDGERASTLQTRVTRGADGRPIIEIGEHAGPGNAGPPQFAISAASELQRALHATPDAIQSYLRWKQTVAAIPMSERVTTAFVQPIIVALNEVLPKRWALENLRLDSPTDSLPEAGLAEGNSI